MDGARPAAPAGGPVPEVLQGEPVCDEVRDEPVEDRTGALNVASEGADHCHHAAGRRHRDLTRPGFGRGMLVLALVWWAWSAYVWAQ